jgi:MazG family protein
MIIYKNINMELKEKKPLYILQEIASILNGKDGCPWDKIQTHESLKPYLIEEAYEVYDAIDNKNSDDLKEELGDLLYQIYSHAEIASKKNSFSIDDVAEAITKKLINRHPHVFGSEEINTPEEVINNWELIKKKEKSHRESILDGVPNHLPALLKAYRVQQKVSRIGFDWDDIGEVFKKLDEELSEFKEALSSGNEEEIVDEAGDILFNIVNILRYKKINSEDALNKSTAKFMKRFKYIEKKAGDKISSMTLEELDSLWNEAKKNN